MWKNIFSTNFERYNMPKTLKKLHQIKDETKHINLPYNFLSCKSYTFQIVIE